MVLQQRFGREKKNIWWSIVTTTWTEATELHIHNTDYNIHSNKHIIVIGLHLKCIDFHVIIVSTASSFDPKYWTDPAMIMLGRKLGGVFDDFATSIWIGFSFEYFELAIMYWKSFETRNFT